MNWGTTNKIKVIRCPYCVEQGNFRPMLAQSNGEWYLCSNCGHLALPTSPLFQCTCSKCVTLDRKTRQHF